LSEHASPKPAPPAIRVALAQIAPTLGDRHRNLDLHLAQIAAAREQGAELIVFPELSLTGYFLRDIVPDVALNRGAAEIQQLIDAAGSAALVAGFVEESAGHHFYNSAFFAEQGRLLHVHRKVYLPTYGLFEEQRYFAAGRRIEAFDSARLGRVGLLICEDFWHLSAAAIMQAEEVDLLICIANSPARGIDAERPRTAEIYDRLARAYAQLLGAMVIVVNRVGFEDGLCFWGGSQIIGPDGSTVAQARLFDEALTVATIDPEELRRERLITPLGRDEQLLLTIEELNRIKRRRYGA
jgi:predicted amidohydrolase